MLFDRPLPRRSFLTHGLTAAAVGAVASPLTAAPQGRAITLRHDPERRLFRVRAELEVKGNVDLAKNALVSKERVKQLPLEAHSVVDYEERLLRSGPLATAAERYYYEASSEGKLSGSPTAVELRDAARRVVTHSGTGRSVSYAQREYLTHGEIDLLRLPANSLAIDDLLPRDSIRVGEGYDVSTESLRRLLDLDAVQAAKVRGQLVEIEGQRAQLQLKGNVQGSVEGVPTTIDVAGKMTFDLQQRAATWLAMAMRERRDIGKAEPGFEVSATLKMIRKPLDKPNAIHRPIKISATPPDERLLVDLTSQQGRFGVLMDRRWRLVSETPGLVTLQMTESDRSIAQCDVRLLGPLKPGEQLTLPALQSDVRQSLRDRFGEFLQAEQAVNSSQLRVLKVSVGGAVQEIPMHWIFVHCSDDSGRRLLATFTLEAENVGDFAGADVQFSGALHFLEPAEGAGAEERQVTEAEASAGTETAQISEDEGSSTR